LDERRRLKKKSKKKRQRKPTADMPLLPPTPTLEPSVEACTEGMMGVLRRLVLSAGTQSGVRLAFLPPPSPQFMPSDELGEVRPQPK